MAKNNKNRSLTTLKRITTIFLSVFLTMIFQDVFTSRTTTRKQIDSSYVTINGDIYLKQADSLKRLNINTVNFIESDASITTDGFTIYFVSNRPGGFGGKDIWMAEKLSNGNWSEPFNLGTKVNTNNNEELPVIMQDGTLFFTRTLKDSSYIYSSTLSDEGLWSVPEISDSLYYSIVPKI